MTLRCSYRLGLAVALLSALLTVACRQQPPEGSQNEPTARTQINRTDPQWVSQATPHKPVAVVFIHGIFGDTLGTWSAGAAQPTFFDYLKSSDVGDQVDVFAFGFTSKMFGDGSLDINEAATKLDQQLKFHRVTDYDTVVFVAHSMGGLITMKLISNRPDLAHRVPLLVFYATPQSGAEIARIAKTVAGGVVKNDALKSMYPADGDAYMRDLNEDWVRVRNSRIPPTLICAYEKSKTFGVMIVPYTTATRHCTEPPTAIAAADHLTIVKPDRQNHDSVVLLVNAIRDHVLPRLDLASWETPDFRQEGDVWVYELVNVTAPNGVQLRNRSHVLQQVSASALEPHWMLLLPEEPQYVAAGGQGLLRMVPIRELQREYHIRLKLGAAPERTVAARIPNMADAIAARAARDSQVVARINAELDTPQEQQAFRALNEVEQHQRISRVAESVIAAEANELPAGARVLLAADTLASIGLHTSALYALRETERRHPAVANMQSARALRTFVATRSREPDVDRADGTSMGQWTSPSTRGGPQAIRADQPEWSALAEHMQTLPTMAKEGLLMKADVLQAQGDTAGARAAYRRASQLTPSPLLIAEREGLERDRAPDP